jgi:hypothetical protein
MVILSVSVAFRTDIDFGEPVLEAGGEGGDAYCMGFGCDRSTVCIMIVRCLSQPVCGDECL